MIDIFYKAWFKRFAVGASIFALGSCDQDTVEQPVYLAIELEFAERVDLNELPNYANQDIPNYIDRDNTEDNFITDEGATLGRVLFYDKNLSVDNSVSCASCHQQAFAFGDIEDVSQGVNGTTGRHSMRLVNARFAQEDNFFWDERASTLEEQTTMPIQDHAEMGFSGENGDPSIGDLITKLDSIEYYDDLFSMAFGDESISEERMQLALAQFIRSIQSFDSKYDEGHERVNNENDNFPNFTADENAGKRLFMTPPNGGRNGNGRGAGCAGCHRAPEFDIDPNSRNNGVTSTIDGGTDESVTRAPSLRDIFNPDGTLNGSLMHNAEFNTIESVIAHYNAIPEDNSNLDNRLRGRNGLQRLNLTETEISQISAFLKTLTGTDVYTNEKWSDPFE